MAELILSSKEFKALSSETRVQIIKLLGKRNHNLTELSAKLKLSAPSIKQHLEVLLGNNLVELVDSDHKWKYYCLTRKGRKLVESSEANVLIVLSQFVVGLVGFLAFLFGVFGFSQTYLTLQESRDFYDSLITAPTNGFTDGASTAASDAVNKGLENGLQTMPTPLIQEPLFQLFFLAVGIVLIAVAIAWFLKTSKKQKHLF